MYNELEVAILRASSLPLGPGDRAPSAYVHFQFLGMKRERLIAVDTRTAC